MVQNVIFLARCQSPAVSRQPRRSARQLLRRLSEVVELLVTAVIGLCILFCLGLTVAML